MNNRKTRYLYTMKHFIFALTALTMLSCSQEAPRNVAELCDDDPSTSYAMPASRPCRARLRRLRHSDAELPLYTLRAKCRRRSGRMGVERLARRPQMGRTRPPGGMRILLAFPGDYRADCRTLELYGLQNRIPAARRGRYGRRGRRAFLRARQGGGVERFRLSRGGFRGA